MNSFSSLPGSSVRGRLLAYLLALLAADAISAVAEDQRSAGPPCDTSAWVGANYTPAYAVNQVQFWHEFKPEVVEKELAAAKRHFGINTLRVYLHNIVYDAEREAFLDRIEQFLNVCDRHAIRPGFTFFDDCWNHKGITVVSEPPVDGRHNGRWAALQDVERKDENLPRFKAYVQDVIRAHANDPRVLWWETYNEPNMQDAFSLKLRALAYQWAKEVKPVHPVIACWDDHDHTDIVNAHNYNDNVAGWDHQADLNPRKGTVFTEAGARWYGKKPSSNMGPIDVVAWLKGRRTAARTVPGVYLCWELMVGNSNCRWYWGTPDGAPEPAIPWCGLLWPDGSPVSYAEAEVVRSYATGKSRALLFEDFSRNEPSAVPRWTRFPSKTAEAAHLELNGRNKLVAEQGPWKDFLLEGTIMIKQDSGNVGLCFRVNDPGPGADDMRGYYVGFDRKTLYLGRMENNWQQLATVDLTARESKVELDTWNLLRVAVEGPRLRVWFNPLHDNTGPVLEFTDPGPAIESGKIACRVQDASAWFDNIVVLPLSVLQSR